MFLGYLVALLLNLSSGTFEFSTFYCVTHLLPIGGKIRDFHVACNQFVNRKTAMASSIGLLLYMLCIKSILELIVRCLLLRTAKNY